MVVDIKKYIFSLILAVALIILLFDISNAQKIDEEEPVDCTGDKIEYSEAGKEIKILGNVIINHKNMKITADKVIVYSESKDIYATGNVTLYKGEDVFTADKVYYNFGSEKGTLIHGDFHSGKLFGEADRLERVSDKQLNALRGYFTTCDFDIPHYRIEAKRIRIYPENKVVAKNVLFYIGNIPAFYFPFYTHSLKEDKPKVTLIPGKDKQWGYFTLIGWRFFRSDYSKGWLRFDWREKLGFGQGIDYEYDTRKYGKGDLKLYYTQERSRLLKEHVPAEKEKYRISLEHKWDIDSDTDVFLEFHKYRDKKFIKDYFYRYYIEDPAPTSHLSITRKRDNYSLNFIMKKRVNHFRSIVEKLPELKFNVNNYKIGDTRLYYTSTFQFDNFNKKVADARKEDTSAIRFHTDNKFTYPTRLIGYLDWLEFSPYVGHLETFYTRDRDGNDRNFFRGQWYSGSSLSTKIYRIFDVEGKYLGVEVNKLRHLISPSVNYTYRHEPTAISSKLGGFDSMDSCSRAKYYTFAVENKLQTKWLDETTSEKKKIDLISLRNSVDFYPQIEGHQYSKITNSLSIEPRDWLKINFTNNYNIYTRDFEIFNVRVEAEKSKWKVEIGSRYTQGNQFHEGTLKATYGLSPKWTLGVYERYDFQKKKLEEQEYSLIRDLHCWTAEIIWNIEESETIWLVFKPKAFPDLPIEWVTSYHKPKIGSQSKED